MQYDFTKRNVFPFWHLVEKGILNVSHDEEIKVGDSFILPFHNPKSTTHGIFEVVAVEILEERPAKGNWEPLDFIPTFYRLRTELKK